MKPDEKATLYSFPSRNRLMAGISKAVLIIEAEEKSGTLVTARLALDYNRDVLAVPGSAFSSNSNGTNWLIKQGATPVTNSEEILIALGFNIEKSKQTDKEKYADCGKNEMKIIPSDENEFLKILQSRHKTLLSARTDKHPGEFKLKNNRAGDTHFVEVKLVRGTLIRGFDYYKILTDPFARTAYMMFLVSEVHPFEDGNGRIARVMMNAELVNRNQCKIIIPTVYREDYLRTLKKLTRDKDPVPYVEMLSKAHEFSSYLNNEDYDKMYKYLATHNAFSEPDEGKRLIID